jgi:hypothetical protein
MQAYVPDVIKSFNQQAEEIRGKAEKHGQETTVSLLTFATEVDAPVFFGASTKALGDLTKESYRPSGNTALFDATSDAIDQMARLPLANDKDTSFLLIVITDGEENSSRKHPGGAGIQSKLLNVQKTDRWTIVFMGPPGCSNTLTKFGVPAGNIQEWEATREAYTASNMQLTASIGNYYGARSAGIRSVSNFFAPDMSNVNRQKLRDNLDNVKNKFKVFTVRPNSVLSIKEFVEQQKINYVKGRAFYQLTKKETVQGYKELCIMETSTGAIYTGPDARSILSIPSGGTIELNPAFDKRYTIFVLSTSTNRKLVIGTQLLYLA